VAQKKISCLLVACFYGIVTTTGLYSTPSLRTFCRIKSLLFCTLLTMVARFYLRPVVNQYAMEKEHYRWPSDHNFTPVDFLILPPLAYYGLPVLCIHTYTS